MPYVLTPVISDGSTGVWNEGTSYVREAIFRNASSERLPPVDYDAHLLRPHSLTHMDAPSHVMEGAKTVDRFFEPSSIGSLYGPVLFLKIPVLEWEIAGSESFVHRVGQSELRASILRLSGHDTPPSKLIVAPDPLPLDGSGMHDPRYAFVLEPSAAEWLVSAPKFNAFGTSWISTDYQPGSARRPIHEILFRQAAVFELLKTADVPEGRYFWCSFPLPLRGASESPVCPVLFSPEELASLDWT